MSEAEALAAKHLGLSPVAALLAELAALDELARRRRVHDVIRLLAGASAEMQQTYRDAITREQYIGRQDWKSALAEAKKATTISRESPADGRADDEPAGVDITDEPTAITGITEVIVAGAIPDVYVRGRQLVEVSSDDGNVQTRDLDSDILRALLSDHVPCVRTFKDTVYPALPHPMTCKAILARASRPQVPRLRGVVSYPVLRGDGTVLQQPGYDQTSGLYLHGRTEMEPIPDVPSAEDVAAAKKFLLAEYLRDFPWISDADRANYLALLMTPLLREIIRGLFPFADITAPERGSGKTLLAQFFEILFGASMRTLPKDDAEMRKSITAALRGPNPVIFFDNIPEYATIRSPSLAAVLTLPMWTDRILSQSREGTWPNDRLWGATGTNVRLGGDFGQRTVLTRIDYGAPRPDLRSGFAIEDIDLWTMANRGKVIRPLLILARHWQAAGAPAGTQRMRNFTRWAQVLGGILGHHEIPGFLGNRDEIEVHDEEAAIWGQFLVALRSHLGDRAMTARDILTDAAASRELGDSLPSTEDGGPHSTKSLGKALSAHEGRWFGDLSIRRSGYDHSAVLWKVVRHAPAPPRGEKCPANSPNSPASQNGRSDTTAPGEFAPAKLPGKLPGAEPGEFGHRANSPGESTSDQQVYTAGEFGEFEPQPGPRASERGSAHPEDGRCIAPGCPRLARRLCATCWEHAPEYEPPRREP